MGRSRGVREERTDHTQLFSRTFAGFGLTGRQKVHFSTFDGKLEGDFITEWSQNLPYGPRPREQKLLFSIFTHPIIHLKNRRNENEDLGFPHKINEFPQNDKYKTYFLKIYQSLGQIWLGFFEFYGIPPPTPTMKLRDMSHYEISTHFPDPQAPNIILKDHIFICWGVGWGGVIRLLLVTC